MSVAKAHFVTPPVQRDVVLTITERQAQTLKDILGSSSVTQHGLFDVYTALEKLFPDFHNRDWAIRKSNGSISG